MGHPLRANIFATGSSSEKEKFSHFPIQVTVLFSQRQNREFYEGFRDMFAYLDKITGDQVIFFALLDPTEEWSKMARQQGREINFTPLGVSFDDAPLVQELAQVFQVQWNELPVLIVSTDLWSTDYVVSQTSINEIEEQFKALVLLARREPNDIRIRDIYDALIPATSGDVLMQRNSSRSVRTDLFHFYNVLDSFDPYRNQIIVPRFRVSTNYLMRQARQALLQVRSDLKILNRASFQRNDRNEQREHNFEDTSWLEDERLVFLFDRAAGFLTAPASVFSRTHHARSQQRRYTLEQVRMDGLEAESQGSLEQSVLIADFLDHEGQRHGQERRSQDLTPALIGIWKALELEVNHSILQVARQTLGITMPDFYLLHQKAFGNAMIKSGKKTLNLNQFDTNLKDGRHRFLTLGDAYYVTQTMLDEQPSPFAEALQRICYVPSRKILAVWQELFTLRNKGAHSQSLFEPELQRTFELANNFDWRFLASLKQAMRPTS